MVSPYKCLETFGIDPHCGAAKAKILHGLYVVLAALIICAGLIAAIHAQPLPLTDPLDQAQQNTQRWIEQQQQQNFERQQEQQRQLQRDRQQPFDQDDD
jgi:uncharacterized protein HemX